MSVPPIEIKDSVSRAIDEVVSDLYCFNEKIFNRKAAHLLLHERSKEVEAALVASIAKTPKDKLDYNAFEAIEYLTKATQTSLDNICGALQQRPDFNAIFKSSTWKVLALFKRTSNDFYKKFFHANYKSLLDEAGFSDVMHRVIKIKEIDFSAAEVKVIERRMVSNMKGGYYSFRSWVPTFAVMYKFSPKLKEIFKKEYIKALDRYPSEKYDYARKEIRFALIRAIKDVRDKTLRRDFIRLILSKSHAELNAALLKYYPKYTKYVAMA